MRIATAFVAAAACLSLGCFVFDELDKGEQELERYSRGKEQSSAAPRADAQPRGGAAAATGKNAEGGGVREWWQKAQTLVSQEKDASIATCHLRGTTQFMSRTDCLSRGGKPAR